MKPKVYIPLSPEAAELNQRHVTRLNYDYRYVTDRSNGYTKSQLFNSAVPSTYQENYSVKDDRKFRGAVIGLCLIVVAVFVGVFELGVLDQVYIDLFLK